MMEPVAAVSAFLTLDFYTRDKPTINFRTIERGYFLEKRTADLRGTVHRTVGGRW
jgi:hypothetical protein